MDSLSAREFVLHACAEQYEKSPTAWIIWTKDAPNFDAIDKATRALEFDGLVKATFAGDRTLVHAQITQLGLRHLEALPSLKASDRSRHMAPSIEDDANSLLVLLAEHQQMNGDSEKGRYTLEGERLQQLLGWDPDRINDAASMLAEDRLVQRMDALGTFPFEFKYIELTTRGRSAYQKLPKNKQPTVGPKQGGPLMSPSPDPRKVFVIHGRNDKARKAMFEFLRAIGLDPIEWNRAVEMTGKTSPYIGEILDVAFTQAHAVLALFTGDDEARLRPEYKGSDEPEEKLTPQARANVIFEAGMAMARSPERTVFVEIGALRPFSDVAGRHTIRFDGSQKARHNLAERLRIAKCAVVTTGTDWHDAGVF